MADNELVICPENPTEVAILELVGDIQKLTDFNVTKMSKDLILNTFEKAMDDGVPGIRVSSGKSSKIKFSVYSDTFSVSEKFFFCKNKTGHVHYLSQVKGKVRHFYNRISQEKNKSDRVRREQEYI